jgi:hypothetical protein
MKSSITIFLSDDCLEQLQEIALRFGITAEELVRFSIEDILA